jgi:hypothetical protein
MGEGWTDAKFKVVRRPRGRRYLWFDWRVFAIIAALALAASQTGQSPERPPATHPGN